MNVAEFLAMGGYGVYVWGPYIVAALAIAVEITSMRIRLGAGQRTPTEDEVRR